MATATYPKKAQHPSMSVGEQESTTFSGGKGGKREYNGKTGPESTRYNGDKVKTTKVSGASGGAAKKEYKKSTAKFGTETGKMEKPCCGNKPKAA